MQKQSLNWKIYMKKIFFFKIVRAIEKNAKKCENQYTQDIIKKNASYNFCKKGG